MKRQTVNFAQVVNIGDTIRKVCHMSNGYAVYDEGYSDAVLAVRFKVSESSIATIRKQIIGQMKKPQFAGIAELTRRIEALELWAACRPKEPFKLT